MVGLVFCCGSAHMTENDGPKRAGLGLLFLEPTDLEDDPVVQRIGSPLLPGASIKISSSQLTVDLGRKTSRGTKPVAG